MKIEDFELELKAIDPNFSIRPTNAPKRILDILPDVAKIATITYMGADVCTIPNFEIYDEKNGNYGVDLRGDGRFVPHRTRPEAIQICKERLERLKDSEYADQFFGRGEYSDEALSRKDNPTPQLVDTVEANVKPVEGGMIEEAK